LQFPLPLLWLRLSLNVMSTLTQSSPGILPPHVQPRARRVAFSLGGSMRTPFLAGLALLVLGRCPHRAAAAATAGTAAAQHRRLVALRGARLTGARAGGTGHKEAGMHSGPLLLNPELQKANAEFYYMLQFPGSVGQSRPRKSLSSLANKCLTAGSIAESGGAALGWHECMAHSIRGDRYGRNDNIFKNQLFQLQLSGEVKSVATGKCVRRTQCKDRFVFDLAHCGDEDSVRFKVFGLVANNQMVSKGSPIQAVVTDYCETICGPYSLERMPKTQPKWKATPGWTKLPTQYIPPNIQPEGRDVFGGLKAFYNDYMDDGVVFSELFGMGPTLEGGICGSYVTDRVQSDVYFLKVGAYTRHNH